MPDSREQFEMSQLRTELPMAGLNLQPQGQYTLEILNNLRATQFAFAVEAVDEGDRTLGDLVAHCLGTDHHLHLKTVTLAFSVEDNFF